MKKKRVVLAGILLLVLLLALWLAFGRQPAAPVEYGVELLTNGSFEQVTSEGLPAGWLPESYLGYSDVTQFDVSEGREGSGITITNHAPNDARFVQSVKVAPNTQYRFSGYIKTASEGGRGANLSVQDVYAFSEALFQTEGEWQYVEFYGRTGAKQHQVTLFARLGGYSGEAAGVASFDDLSLVAVEEVPGNALVYSWEKPTAQKPAPADAANAKPFAPWLLLIYAFAALGLVYLARLAQSQESRLMGQQQERMAPYLLLTLLVVSFVLRLLLARTVQGFPVDVGAFRAWANDMAAVGPGQFYLQEGHRDYPPGYMLVLWPIGLLGRLLGGGATMMMVKIPAILCDIMIIALLYRVASRRVNRLSAVTLSALYAFNPLTFLAGAAWGQVDSLPSLLLMIAVLFIMKKRWRYALPVYVLAVLMKPQALMVGPLGLIALVMAFVWKKDKGLWKDVLIGTGASLLVIAAVALPFFNEENGVSWLIGLYGNTMSFYNYASVNAFNLHFLFGQNWVGIQNPAPFLLRLCGNLVVLVPSLLYGLHLRKKQEGLKPRFKLLQGLLLAGVLLPALTVLLPMSLSLAGTLLMVSVFFMVAFMYVQGGDESHLPFLASVLLIGFSVLGTMMHERYLFLAVALLSLSYVMKPDRRVLALLLAVTALCFINSGIALDRGIRVGGSMGNLDAPTAGLVSDSAWLEYALSFLSLPLTGYALYLGLVLSRKETAVQTVKTFERLPDVQPKTRYAFLKKKEQVRFDRKDALIILVVTLLYAVLALTNLGSTVAPQKEWVSGFDQEDVVLDLGAQHHFNLLLYGGVHWETSEFEVSVSKDGEEYTSYPFQMEPGDLFCWRFLGFPYVDSEGKTHYDSNPRYLEGRYVKISGMTSKLTLFEVIAQDAATGENIPFVSASEGAQALIDEQDTLSGKPTWFNSMYFDEIYHARTGYEQRNALLGLEPSHIYETSHPPLGKVFITFAQMIFGMTPFGWRFAGALAGILMLPGMYLLGKLFTKKRLLGLLAMLLLTFDTMHFTQTRIATIDSFVTLFIIYAYYFMFRYMLLDHIREKFSRKMVLLFLSGLMMGLGMASKWSGMYAAMGLAVLFLFTLVRNLHMGYVCSQADQATFTHLETTGEEARAYGRRYIREAVITCLWCLLFFVAIPAVIYYLSYIPVYIASPGGVTLQKIIRNNLSMYDYHAKPGRGADHYWASTWNTWPLSLKPMYYYAGGVKNGTSSVIWAMGSPLVWWSGFAAMLMTLGMAIRERLTKTARIKAYNAGRLQQLSYDARPLMLLIAYAAQYLPWVLVPRGTYIYHYFPSVPFIILMTALMVDYLHAYKPRVGRITAIVLMVLAAGMFVGLFPYISGVRVSTAWLEAMRWPSKWLTY